MPDKVLHKDVIGLSLVINVSNGNTVSTCQVTWYRDAKAIITATPNYDSDLSWYEQAGRALAQLHEARSKFLAEDTLMLPDQGDYKLDYGPFEVDELPF